VAAGTPRVVLVTRSTDLEALLVRHGTREQARFFLESRGQKIEDVEERHILVGKALQAISQAIPVTWRRLRLDRSDLASFLFEPEDLVLVLGQDGLVANAAKYLDGQLVLGVNPDPQRFEGILVPLAPIAVPDLLRSAGSGRAKVEERTMAEVQLDDGQTLLALNEIFVGHRSHQSARERLRWQAREERQSSSGLIVATGTGATGWAKSIHHERHAALSLPAPAEPRLAFFVREAWPSRWTQAELTEGLLECKVALEITSEMNEDGVIFGDGIEADHLEFSWGMRATVGIAQRKLRLVQA
jgi:NAD kinase